MKTSFIKIGEYTQKIIEADWLNPGIWLLVSEDTKEQNKRCIDFDSDCLTISDYHNCYMYDTETGTCPFINRNQ